MAIVWITYCWEDNKNQEVDFIAQELLAAGVTVKLDRWNVAAGLRLWPQIEKFIQSPDASDAWLLYATQASLASEPCREEFALALDRALQTRGSTFPVMALFPSGVEQSLIPASIRIRLHISLADPDWKERIVAATQGRAHNSQRSPIAPFIARVHKQPAPSTGYSIEIRPRAGSWAPFIAGVPADELNEVNPDLDPDLGNLCIVQGPPGAIPMAAQVILLDSPIHEGWAFSIIGNEASPTMSCYVMCAKLPSKLRFGAYKSSGGYLFDIEPRNLSRG